MLKTVLAGEHSERTALDHRHQYTQIAEEGKYMGLKQLVEQLKGLPPATQVVLVVFTLVIVVLLVVYPTAGTSIIAFLVALKMLATQR